MHGVNGRPSPAGPIGSRCGLCLGGPGPRTGHIPAPGLEQPPGPAPAAHCLVLGAGAAVVPTHLIPSFPHQIICNRHQAIGPSLIQFPGFVLSQPFFCAWLILKGGPSSGPAFQKLGGRGGLYVCVCVCLRSHTHTTCAHTHKPLPLITEGRI